MSVFCACTRMCVFGLIHASERACVHVFVCWCVNAHVCVCACMLVCVLKSTFDSSLDCSEKQSRLLIVDQTPLNARFNCLKGEVYCS